MSKFIDTKNIRHDSTASHVNGTSEFIDDRPIQKGELFIELYCSKIAKGKIKEVDFSKALEVDGVHSIYTAKDIAHNSFGPIFQEQPFLADKEVNHVGEPIAIIAVEKRSAFALAKKAMIVKIEEEKPILTIDEAIKKEAYISVKRTIKRGNLDEAFKDADHILEGTFENNGQEHFYLENQCSIAYPEEQGRIVVHSSSQHPSETQHAVAEAIGLKFSDVVCVVKRMGGGFGGKESQAAPLAAYAALVANATKKTARLNLTKDDDMIMTGKRHPFKNNYKIGFDKEGKILAYKVDLYSNGGAYADLSTAIMERAMLHADSAYFLPNVEINGRVCRTNITSNTAFRGFGGPQGALVMESIIEEMSQVLKIDPLSIREKNYYKEGFDTAPYGQKIENNTLPELFTTIKTSVDYDKKRAEINDFNKKEKTKLRGLSITPCKFGISFTSRFLNQGNALVNVHLDGTVQASTGATEMGQGVNTKVQTVICEALGIPHYDVRIMPTSTEKNHNTSPTAASSGSDLNCAAALLAANQIKERLAELALIHFEKPELTAHEEYEISGNRDVSAVIFADGKIKSGNKEIDFIALIKIAYFNRISLSGYGFFKTPGIHFDKEVGIGEPFLYYTNGVSASEVELDRFTGEVKVLRTDLLMDLGRSMNEGIDRGQVAGGFMQGLGWSLTEDLKYNEKGFLTTHSPSTYKIPSIQDIPRIFNIDFIDNTKNTKNVRQSKAVGEPPFLLGFSVFCAVKNALSYVNNNAVKIKLPATSEEVLMELNRLESLK